TGFLDCLAPSMGRRPPSVTIDLLWIVPDSSCRRKATSCDSSGRSRIDGRRAEEGLATVTPTTREPPGAGQAALEYGRGNAITCPGMSRPEMGPFRSSRRASPGVPRGRGHGAHANMGYAARV